MNRVLSFTESAVLSYGPALATAIIPININSRHISRVRNSESVPERFNSDLVLAKSPPSRSKDKAGLTARTRRRLQDLLAVFLLPPSPCYITSSFLTRSPRDLAARDSSTSHDNDLGAIPIKKLPPELSLFKDCFP